jgi:HSP20 family protein
MNDTMVRTANGTTREETTKPAPVRRVTLTPRVDILEQPNKLVLFVDLPGVKAEDVELNFEKGELTVRARREVAAQPGRCLVNQFEGGEYYRSFLLSQDIAADKITAELRNGVLTVDLPRSPAALPRRINVKA